MNGEHAIKGISRLSSPGRRSYCGYRDIPQILGGLGISILSTPKGIMDDKSAKQNKLGGELLCSVCKDCSENGRIGKVPVDIPSGVEVTVNDNVVTVKRP